VCLDGLPPLESKSLLKPKSLCPQEPLGEAKKAISGPLLVASGLADGGPTEAQSGKGERIRLAQIAVGGMQLAIGAQGSVIVADTFMGMPHGKTDYRPSLARSPLCELRVASEGLLGSLLFQHASSPQVFVGPGS
jgi:hypothetical protein